MTFVRKLYILIIRGDYRGYGKKILYSGRGREIDKRLCALSVPRLRFAGLTEGWSQLGYNGRKFDRFTCVYQRCGRETAGEREKKSEKK